jgi:hypothetical protein
MTATSAAACGSESMDGGRGAFTAHHVAVGVADLDASVVVRR